MKPLIETTSPLYVRRLVRELNKEENGFYSFAVHSERVVRCNHVRLSGGGLVGRTPFGWTPIAGPHTDPYGREIVASRKSS
jgi:hypothetical protein